VIGSDVMIVFSISREASRARPSWHARLPLLKPATLGEWREVALVGWRGIQLPRHGLLMVGVN
jgi:hypothetical protein